MNKNILYICLEPLRQGHAAYTHVTEIVKGLEKQGWTVTLVSPKYSQNTHLPGFFKRLWTLVSLQIKSFPLFLKAQKVYIRWHPLTLISHLLAKFLRRDVYQEINGPYEDLFIAWPRLTLFKKPIIFFMRKQLVWAHHIFAVTEGLGAFARRESSHERVTVIPNGANTEIFHPHARAKESYKLPSSYVIFFGTFAEWQGLPIILKAAQLETWPASVSLVLVGDGALRKNVETAVASTPHILYLGRIPYEDMGGIVASALLTAMPMMNPQGRAETQLSPLKLFESLACGTPVAVSETGGLGTFVRDHGCGLVVEPNTPEAWAQEIQKVFQNPSFASYGQKGYELVLGNYSWSHLALQIHKILEG